MKRKRDPHGLIFFLYYFFYSSSLWCYRCFQINKSSNEKPKHKQECNPKKELGQKLFIFSLWRSSRCWNTKQHLKVLKNCHGTLKNAGGDLWWNSNSSRRDQKALLPINSCYGGTVKRQHWWRVSHHQAPQHGKRETKVTEQNNENILLK